MPESFNSNDSRLANATFLASAIGAGAFFKENRSIAAEAFRRTETMMNQMRKDTFENNLTKLPNRLNRLFNDTTMPTNLAIDRLDRKSIFNIYESANQLVGNNRYVNNTITRANFNTRLRQSAMTDFISDPFEDIGKSGALVDFVTRASDKWETSAILATINNRDIFNMEFGRKYLGNYFDDSEIENIFEFIHDFKDNNPLESFNIHSEITTDVYERTFNFDDLSKILDVSTQTTGDRKATIGDILNSFNDDASFGLNQQTRNMTPNTMLGTLQRRANLDDRINNLVAGGGLRINEQGVIYSTASMTEPFKMAKESLNNSLFGKILKSNEIANDIPNVFHIPAGTHDPVLAALERGNGAGTSRLRNNYFYINQKFYKHNLITDALEHLEELDDYTLSNARTSFIERSARIVQGDQTSRSVNNKILNRLDLGTSGTRTIYEEVGSRFTKFKDPLFTGNIIDHVLNGQLDVSTQSKVIDEFKKIKKLKKEIPNLTEFASFQDIIALQEVFGIDTNRLPSISKDLLNIASLDDKQMIESIISYRSHLPDEMIMNPEVSKLISRYKTNTSKALSLKRKTLEGNVGFMKLLRQEITKEALLTSSQRKGFDTTFSIINESQRLTSKQKQIFTEMNVSNLFEALLPTEGLYSVDEMARSVRDVHSYFKIQTPRTKYAQQTSIKALQELKDERFGFLGMGVSDHLSRQNIQPGYSYGDYIVTKKVNPFKTIAELNEREKLGGFINQFFASRNNMKDFSAASAIGVHSVDRLTHGLERFGLGFSPKSTQSALDMAMNIGLKRVLPVAAGLTALSYLNFETENITGTSMTQGMGNLRANTSLMFRSNLFANTMNALRDTLVPLQYIFDEPIMNREEYKEYLEEGYDPVRKGRFWSFGSMSEFRGGKISYFKPSYLRASYSHARDVSLYGSEDEKWKHSWIPTPRHPFSPIRRLLDPYYLEKKHYDDRPYPMTGKMFSEGTPWGAILNPTIGRLLKPQRRMHVEDSKHGIVDSRDIISAQNEYIRDKASNKIGLISFKADGQYNNMIIDKTMNTAYSNTEDINQNAEETLEAITDKSFMNKVLGYAPINDMSPIEIISQQNSTIRARAHNLVDAPIFDVKKSYGTDEYNQARAIYNNRAVQNTFDYTSDLFYSMSELSGIYGFLGEEVFNKKKRYRLASSDTMTGATDWFWEQNIGGLGGEIMEIGRRFIPHEDRSINRINYLRNTMPTWMPSKFRYGDPYDQIPQGEMRLPGRGFETLNTLHPDDYGMYGAFDRAKILADIAPWSSEYKQWKKIARQQAKGKPHLEKQLEKMEMRVKRQSKSHEFFNYKFRGETTDEEVIIKEVMSGGRFRVIGDSSIYRLAGIEMKDDADISNVIAPGLQVIMSVDKNKENRADQYGIISAAIKTKNTFGQIESINKKLVKEGYATKDREDISAASTEAFHGELGQFIGGIAETLAHYPVPFFHDKFMRVDTPLESYKNQQIYGTPYATWSHPIKGFLIPSMRRGMSQSNSHQLLAFGTMMVSEYFDKVNASKKTRTIAHAAQVLTNRGAMTGAILENLYKGNIGPAKLFSTKTAKVLPKVFSGAMMIGSSIAKSKEDLGSAIISGAITGTYLTRGLSKKYRLAGLLGGMATTSFMNINYKSLAEPDKAWIPRETEDRRALNEYFDRLTYKKYRNLYLRASQLAREEEGIDIDKMLNRIDEITINKNELMEDLQERRQRIIQMYSNTSKRRARLLREISEEMKLIQKPETGLVAAGEYTKSAVAYRRAYESTVYGLKKNASWSQMLRALPKTDRDYILEFAKVKDPKKRKEIMKYIDPYQRKVLQIAWKEDKIDEPESNMKYFMSHANVSKYWKGMRADVDLEKVKIKTIANEGMELADFGYYESQLEDPTMDTVPELPNMAGNLLSLLFGESFDDAEVSITPNMTNDMAIAVSFENTLGSIMDFLDKNLT